jgi:hypothetical protein
MRPQKILQYNKLQKEKKFHKENSTFTDVSLLMIVRASDTMIVSFDHYF